MCRMKSVPGLSVQQVRSGRDLEIFLGVPFVLHKNEPFWVPVPKFIEKDQLSPDRNPFWTEAKRELFVAMRDGSPVGRIVAIQDNRLDKNTGERVGAWGYFVCEENVETALALFQAVEAWHAQRPEGEAVFLRGPLNPSLNYTAGLLVEGFDHFPCFMTPYNPEYYHGLIAACGMAKEEDLYCYRFSREVMQGLCDSIFGKTSASDSEYRIRRSVWKTFFNDMRLLAEMFDKCWSDNWGFTPLTAEEIHYSWSLMRYLPVSGELFFLEHRGQTVGMVLFGADLGPLFKLLNGRMLSLSTPFNIVKGLRSVKGVRIYLLGVTPKYRRTRAIFRLLNETINMAMATPTNNYVDGGWILERNIKMIKICEHLGGKVANRLRIYRRECTHGK